jgi:hypothetical protein
MKQTLAVLLLSTLPSALAQFPKGFGSVPVPNGPAPTGCNAYEIIVARGTMEPGPFGFIVGDPLVAGVQKLLPDVRGYAVQVGYPVVAAIVELW